jgi:hypothetical protein
MEEGTINEHTMPDTLTESTPGHAPHPTASVLPGALHSSPGENNGSTNRTPDQDLPYCSPPVCHPVAVTHIEHWKYPTMNPTRWHMWSKMRREVPSVKTQGNGPPFFLCARPSLLAPWVAPPDQALPPCKCGPNRTIPRNIDPGPTRTWPFGSHHTLHLFGDRLTKAGSSLKEDGIVGESFPEVRPRVRVSALLRWHSLSYQTTLTRFLNLRHQTAQTRNIC